MHYFDTRPDPLSVAFTKNFPCESHFGLWTTMGALIISQQLFGFTTRLGKLVEPGEEGMIDGVGVGEFVHVGLCGLLPLIISFCSLRPFIVQELVDSRKVDIWRLQMWKMTRTRDDKEPRLGKHGGPFL